MQGEYDDRPVQRTVETLLASHRLGHVVSEEEPFVRRLPDSQLVGERDAVFVHTAEVVDAVAQLVPVRLLDAQRLEAVALDHASADLLDRPGGVFPGDRKSTRLNS